MHTTRAAGVMGCLHDPANVQQTSSKCIQSTRANAGRLLDRVNTLLMALRAALGQHKPPPKCRSVISLCWTVRQSCANYLGIIWKFFGNLLPS